MILAPAGPSDIDAVVRLVNSAYRGEGARAGWTTEAGVVDGQRIDRAMLETDLARIPGATILVASEAGGGLQGCVWLEPPEPAYLGMLTVRPDLQAAGLGRRLLEAGEAWARERGAGVLRMTVVQVRDSLIAWCERRGYHRTGETRPFPYEDHRFGVPSRADLHFIVLEKHL